MLLGFLKCRRVEDGEQLVPLAFPSPGTTPIVESSSFFAEDVVCWKLGVNRRTEGLHADHQQPLSSSDPIIQKVIVNCNPSASNPIRLLIFGNTNFILCLRYCFLKE